MTMQPPSATPGSSGQQPKRWPWPIMITFGLVAAVVLAPERTPGRVRAADPSRPDAKPATVKGDQRSDSAGHEAASPKDLPARSWFQILKRVVSEISNDRVLSVAASVTFYALLSIFPAIVALVSLYGLFADANTISDHLSSLTGMLPGGAIDIIGEQVKRIASKPGKSLGFGFAVGLGTALWSANAGVKAMFDALNIVYDEKEKRNFFVLNAMSLAFTLGAIVFILLALGAVVVVPVLFKFLALPPAIETTIGLARWPVLLVIIAGVLALLYRFGPSRKKPRWRWVTWGSAFAAVGWVVGSILFSWYVSKFGSYNETYGSLGAAIGFMTWIWISSTIVLVGAEINAEMEHETAQDTTEGGQKPMGTRGATMADQVA